MFVGGDNATHPEDPSLMEIFFYGNTASAFIV